MTENSKPHSVLDDITAPVGSFDWMLAAQEAVISSGWRWQSLPPVFAKLREEVTELEEATTRNTRDEMVSELGDLLWMASILCHYLNINPHEAISAMEPKLRNRFGTIEQQAKASGRTVAEVPVAEQRDWYRQIKEDEKKLEAAE